jgi:LysR family transcriptional regulator, low CO2-responsive transcriptional regulator
MKAVTLRQLRVFTEVARHLSFVRAAEALHLTPPAITMQVQDLEAQVGLPLLERQGRKVSLTTAGEYLLVYARRMLATLKDASDAMDRLKRVEAGELTVGMVSTAKYFLPRLLTRFRQEHPAIDIQLRVGNNREQLVAWMQQGEIDLAIMGRPPKEMATRAEPFAAHPHVFLAPPEHPILRYGRTPAVSLADFALIVREPGSGTRALMDRFFADQRVEPRIGMEMPSNESIKQAVMAGMGLGFLSLHTVGLELQCGLLKILDIVDTPIIRTWNVVHQQSKLLSPAAEALRYFMIEHGEAHLAEHDSQLLGLPAS